jgi:hypothetical protein
LSRIIKLETMETFGMNSMKCEMENFGDCEWADGTISAVASWRRDRWEGQCFLVRHKVGQVVLNPKHR